MSQTTDTQWWHKSKISENLGRCGRQNMLCLYLKIWELQNSGSWFSAVQWRRFPHRVSVGHASHQTRRPCKLKTLQTYKQFTKKFAIMKVAKEKSNRFLQGLNWFQKHGQFKFYFILQGILACVMWILLQVWLLTSLYWSRVYTVQ